MSSRSLPRALCDGDTIGVLATAAATAALCPRRFARAQAALEGSGYRARIAPGVLRKPDRAWEAGSPQQCADDLHALVDDDTVAAIIATVGGLVTNRMLGLVDWELLEAKPKLLIGYSDLTVLQAALWTRTGIGAICGPALLPQFGEPGGPDSFTAEALKLVAGSPRAVGQLPHPKSSAVSQDAWDVDDEEPRKRLPSVPPRVIREGHGQGPLVVANLDSLLRLAGTPWFPPCEGALLALEVTDDVAPARLHADLTQLEQIGVFDRVAGLLLGRCAVGAEVDDAMLDAIIGEVAGGSFPIASGFAFGHSDPMLSLPWGVLTALDAEADVPTITLLEPAVSPA